MWYWNARGMRSPTVGGYAIAPIEIPNAYCIFMSSSILSAALATKIWKFADFL
ncbi:hypothetical protein [Nostoc sp.]|uniref:hypothetical protein n=1 Tax=Nostoc sp. TaxID=1180 RepID=UPI002FF510C6